MRRKIRIFCVNLLGRRIHDYKNGEFLGKALIFTWGGSIHIWGYTGSNYLVVNWLPEDELSYWKSKIGFTTRNDV